MSSNLTIRYFRFGISSEMELQYKMNSVGKPNILSQLLWCWAYPIIKSSLLKYEPVDVDQNPLTTKSLYSRAYKLHTYWQNQPNYHNRSFFLAFFYANLKTYSILLVYQLISAAMVSSFIVLSRNLIYKH